MQDFVPEKHIFKNVEHFFTERIHSFHDKFVDCSLLTGVDKPEAKLDKIKMTKNPKFTLLYYKRIVGGLQKNKPLSIIRSFNKEQLVADCGIYYLNNDKDIDDFFFTQNVCNWNGSNKTCYQVWRLKKNNFKQINKHWL